MRELRRDSTPFLHVCATRRGGAGTLPSGPIHTVWCTLPHDGLSCVSSWRLGTRRTRAASARGVRKRLMLMDR